MKLSVTQENLSKALGTAGRIVSTRASLPVLSNVLLATENHGLRIASNNLEIGINYWIGGKVETEGRVTIPSRLLGEFVSSIPSGTLELTAEDSNLTIKSDNYNSTINGISADEFPLIPEVKSDPVLTLPIDDMKIALSEVVVACALDESRPVLAGVYMHIDDGMLVLAATDSFRLAERRMKLPKGTKAELSVIVPSRTIQELIRILGDSKGEVAMYLADNQVMFRLENIELISRVIEGQFPNYQQIIPETEETSATLDTAEFTRITKMANLFARENGGGVRIEVQAEGEIRIMSSASQVGENTSSAECEVAGDDGETALNAKFLTDALATVSTKTVSFSMSGKLSPCVIRPEGDDAHEYLHIIMPLRT
jgi:DNA polymerase III subunit beta